MLNQSFLQQPSNTDYAGGLAVFFGGATIAGVYTALTHLESVYPDSTGQSSAAAFGNGLVKAYMSMLAGYIVYKVQNYFSPKK